MDVVSIIFQDTEKAAAFMRWFGNDGEEQFKQWLGSEGKGLSFQPDFNNFSYEEQQAFTNY